jgi:hypothetical protein
MAGAQWFAEGADRLPAVGAPVEVRQRYTERWAGGFEVADIDLTGNEPAVAVRRRSDGSVLPATFPVRDVRTA